MAKITYNKLIRDRIPEIIKNSGKNFQVEEMTSDNFEQSMYQKLLEESGEIQKADDAHIISELADLEEVIDAILALKGISRQELLHEQIKRREERGGFERKYRLLWTE